MNKIPIRAAHLLANVRCLPARGSATKDFMIGHLVSSPIFHVVRRDILVGSELPYFICCATESGPKTGRGSANLGFVNFNII